ncbi:MAG: flap endonuclease-1 [Candidatus Aenigmatarchaeota archaeon]
MGVQLTDIIKSRSTDISSLLGKTIAIDAFNWIYQFLAIIRQSDGTPLKDSKGRVTSHLSGLFYRTSKLMQAGIKPMYVFDGKKPDMKEVTVVERRDAREEARKAWQSALKAGNIEEARKQAMRSTQITGEVIESSKKLLDALGIPVLQAESEGEALCSSLVRDSKAYAAASQDYDTLLFGCPRLVRNLSITGRKKRGNDYIIIEPEIIILKDILADLGVNQNQLICLGILVGTDFNPGGVRGIGPKKALELVKKKKTFSEIMEGIDWQFDYSPKEIFNFFRNPEQIGDKEINFMEINEKRLKAILCDEHDFSEERVDSALQKISERPKQSSLASWMKK